MMLENAIYTALSPEEAFSSGLVSSQSASWGENITTWQADHAQQIGWFNEPSFDWRDGWRKILNQLKEMDS